jgi:hypothetical protein
MMYGDHYGAERLTIFKNKQSYDVDIESYIRVLESKNTILLKEKR